MKTFTKTLAALAVLILSFPVFAQEITLQGTATFTIADDTDVAILYLVADDGDLTELGRSTADPIPFELSDRNKASFVMAGSNVGGRSPVSPAQLWEKDPAPVEITLPPATYPGWSINVTVKQVN